MKVRLTPEARSKLDAVLDRILRDNPFAARRYRSSLGRALLRLGRFPQLGHFIAEYPSAPAKQFLVEPYRFFYFIDERHRTVWVIDIWHGAQLPADPHLSVVGPEQ
jgi:plasmid stabilization system protein ParE